MALATIEPDMPKLSAVIVALNEERHLEKCLQSLAWVDEIIVVDDGSTDKTIEIAKKYTEKVYNHRGQGYVEPSRNFAIEKATGEWILILDADEAVPESLATKIRSVVEDKEEKVYCVQIPRKNIVFGKWMRYTGWWPDYHPRLFRRGSIKWPEKIHAKPDLPNDCLQLEAKEEYAILHDNFETVSEYIQRLDRYTTVEAKELYAQGKRFSIHGSMSAFVDEFLSRLFAHEGYKDGLHGFALSFLQGFSQLVLYIKIWEHEKFKDEKNKETLRAIEHEVRISYKKLFYWFAFINQQKAKNIVEKIIYSARKRLNRV